VSDAESPFEALSRAVLDGCRKRGVMLATAESCTGGMIAAALTDIAGSSDVVDRGFVTYSNPAKMEMLGVSGSTLDTYGAVSRETALEMAAGALARSRAGIALSVTGIAGPGGGSADKPVGLVWFGLAMTGNQPLTERRLFEDRGRASIRRETVRTALEMALAALGAQAPAGRP
jgi:nicotinamide-nucleotide amidase